MLRIPVRVSYRQWLYGLLTLAAVGGLIWPFLRVDAGAIDGGWLSGNLGGEIISNQDYDLSAARCRHEVVEVQAGPRQEMCVYQARSFQWAQYFEYPGTYLRTVVRFNNEQRMHLIDNFVDGTTLTAYGFLLSGTDSNSIVFNRWGTTWIIKDFPSSLSPSIEHPGRLVFNRDAIHEISVDETGAHTDTYTGGISQNGKWMALTYMGAGILKINLETLEITLISQDGLRQRYMFDLSISNDGQYVVIMGNDRYPPRIINTSNECGIESTALLRAWKSSVDMTQDACQQRDISGELQDMYGGSYIYAHSPVFAPGDKEVFLRIAGSIGDSQRQSIRLLSSAYDQQRLDYLALGDSYSSGEGDLVNKGDTVHYIPGTERPGECHVSDRSYPFLLRDKYEISPNQMKSVACSGAQVMLDYVATPASYKGQHGELLRLDATERDLRQRESLNSFNPGIVPQLEFVKKYHPTTLTLTGGGNDVGFADILAYCATPAWQGFFADDTCGYAVEDSDLEKILYDTIDTQYGYTKMLLTAIRSASPQTRVVVVGYPSFVSETHAGFCTDQVAALNAKERKMMNKAVNYMNSMLRRISRVENVTFVDVEESLYGGRLCEGGRYMTGMADLGFDKALVTREHNEMFHPNSAGHKRIAEVIIQQNAFYENNFDQEADYVVPSDVVSTVQVQDAIQGGDILRDRTLTIHLQAGAFQPNSPVVISAHSTPTELGAYVAGDDGSLDVQLSATKLPPGRHVLIMAGLSYGNEPVRYTQFATVRASEADADGDGILDENDRCDYISAWIDEVSGQDICIPSLDKEDSRALDNSPLAGPVGQHPLPVAMSIKRNDLQAKLGDVSNTTGRLDSLLSKENTNTSLEIVILILTTLGILYGLNKITEIKKYKA